MTFLAGYINSYADSFVLRLTTDGSLDPGFGTGGIAVTSELMDIMYFPRASRIPILSDGKLLIAGYASNGSDNDAVIERYNTDGSVDYCFGTGGMVTTSITPGYDDNINCIFLQNDGKMVVVGTTVTTPNTTDNDFFVVRYQ